MISILIAARNEAHNIVRCLSSISALSYPLENLEVLIGNDHSEDNTNQIIANYIQDKPHMHLYDITDHMGLARGKGNVLAQLIRQARGDYFFITDADIEVPRDWIQSMMAVYEPGVGTITGVTLVDGPRIFHKLQAIEWAQALGSIKFFSDLNIPITAMGNNMMITREAYESTGGYENLPFSITEDYQLFRETLKRGFAFKHVMSAGVLALSKPVDTWSALLHQRKRWMSGAMQLPFYMIILFFVQVLLFPLVLVLFFVSPQVALLLWTSKIILQSLSVFKTLYQLRSLHLFKYLFLYEGYYIVMSIASIIFYFSPSQVVWKGRMYTKS